MTHSPDWAHGVDVTSKCLRLTRLTAKGNDQGTTSIWGQRLKGNENPGVGEPQSTLRPNKSTWICRYTLPDNVLQTLLKYWRLLIAIWDFLIVKLNYRVSDNSVLAVVPNVDQGQNLHKLRLSCLSEKLWKKLRKISLDSTVMWLLAKGVCLRPLMGVCCFTPSHHLMRHNKNISFIN